MLEVKGKINLCGKEYEAKFRPIEEYELEVIDKHTKTSSFPGKGLYTFVKHDDAVYNMQYLSGSIHKIYDEEHKIVADKICKDPVYGGVRVPAIMFVAEITEKDSTNRDFIRRTVVLNETKPFGFNIAKAYKTTGNKMYLLCEINVRTKNLMRYFNAQTKFLARVETIRDCNALLNKIAMLTNLQKELVNSDSSDIEK